MTVKVNPVSRIKARIGLNPGGDVPRVFAEICKTHMDSYVPRRSGILRGSARIINNNQILYNTEYAHYIYEGKKYVMDNGKSAYYSPTYGFWSKPHTPKVDSGELLNYRDGFRYWDREMWSAEKDQCLKELEDYIGGKR